MSTPRVAVIQDESSLAEVVGLYMKRAGYQVHIYKDGQVALDAMQRQIPDLVVLDLMLPKVDGFTITRWLRDRCEAPIIMLTARRDEFDRIAGLEMGADDYVVKPTSPQELVSRVRAVLRRTRGSAQKSGGPPLVLSELVINLQTCLVTIQRKEIVLTAKEFDLLWTLASDPPQVFTRAQLLEDVWGMSDYIDPSTVTVHICSPCGELAINSSLDHKLGAPL